MSLALYRKYRPGTFAEVKGQEHVTDPLRQALRTGRVNHAYLFSGPRGCGKTSSARILARSLNCEKGPTPDPCGVCDSCVALAPTGPGHLDVIEIDAASHGGVDDARDLRERAFFAPVSARFKIYIIDEAHMVTREGFNALLKLVEEPPPHLKFIFATTEPEKVIGTIKSRTHHYPFRLMPPATLRGLLEEILTSENVPFEPAALPLVVRVGAGSARDSLSILDQLLAGAEEDGITYAKAVSLLGYTDGDLLDEVVHAFAARDGGKVFQAVNRVIEGGHDPRRFAADLLERFRDLVILANVPEAATSGLLDRPADELERLVQQAASMGPAELTRAAEVFNAGLTEMRGATSPRLLLELMCARVLLPGAAQGEAALLARLERLERGGTVAAMAARATTAPAAPAASGVAGAGGVVIPRPGAASARLATAGPSAGGGPGAPAQGMAQGDASPAQAGGSAPGQGGINQGQAGGTTQGQAGGTTQGQGGGTSPYGSGGSSGQGASAGDQGPAAAPAAADDWPEPARPGAPAAPAAAASAPPVQAAPAGGGQAGAAVMQQQWPAVLAALKQRSIVVWANVSTNAQVVGVEGNVVTLGFGQVGAMKNFTGGGKDAVVASALSDVLGGTWRVEAVVGNGPPPPSSSAGRGGGRPPAQPAYNPPPAPDVPSPAPSAQGGSGHQGRTSSHAGSHDGQGDQGAQDPGQPPAAAVAVAAPARPTTDESWPDAPDDPGPSLPPSPDPTRTMPAGATPSAGLAAARSAAKAAAQAGPRSSGGRGGAAAWPDVVPGRAKGPDSDEVDPLNDADADVDAVSGMALLERELGARVIGEIDHT
ncbi:DNA polymerase III subunit tau [Nonomuraea coxensis DSM 45129]|uniref:DNA-directed DNA polymerase n=1 Tax=Nonomuraea coxensis DSM 45129 TaxID=1122611 RepID=A0ABX8UEP9_9ACTN|nr:DNA polymerase III subunit gamma and tau [Nonomuraea coxensis]QYC45965.1 DNA polymerase III subunit tau [Nonomuraea coxensis DSM 45129]